MEISNGRGYTWQGAQMACRKDCRIAGGFIHATLMNGRPRVLHGDITSAGCPLISTLNDEDGVSSEGGESVAEKYYINADGVWTPITAASTNESAQHEDPYDEQPQLVTSIIEGTPFFVETMDGRTFSGRASINGSLPRIDTYGEDEYTAYWGDEALAKIDGAKS